MALTRLLLKNRLLTLGSFAAVDPVVADAWWVAWTFHQHQGSGFEFVR